MDEHSRPVVPKTYRVRGIPPNRDTAHRVQELLCSGLGSNCGAQVYSLASDPSSPQPDLVATVTFQRTPVLLRNGGDRWVLPGSNEKIIIDTHFRGFTPLNDVSSGQEVPI